MTPRTDVPVVQLSIDERQPPEYHYDLGKRLALLREEGVLIVGSGNLVRITSYNVCYTKLLRNIGR